MDAAVLLDAEEHVVAWPNMKDSDVVSQVLSAYQITVQADDTSVVYDEDRMPLGPPGRHVVAGRLRGRWMHRPALRPVGGIGQSGR